MNSENNNAQRLFILLAIILVVVLLLSVGILMFPRAAAQNLLEVDFLDVGQGDAILIKTPEHQNILIDGGPDVSVVQKLGEYLPFYEREIDYMILTHPHSDHVAGLVEVLKRYKVKNIFHTGVVHTSPDYLAWLEEIKKEHANVQIIDQPQDVNLEEGLDLKFLFPQKSFSGKRVESLNNTSIVAKLIYGGKSFLFTGDLEKEGEEVLLKSGVDISADVLKVGHHGSSGSGSNLFLDKVNPGVAVIQSGKDNKFGHPTYRTVRNLERRNIQIRRNDLEGDIVIKSDGKELQ